MKHVHIKLQSVEHRRLDFTHDTAKADTLGQEVDRFIAEAMSAGRVPNKLVIDLNPPEEPNPAAMDE